MSYRPLVSRYALNWIRVEKSVFPCLYFPFIGTQNISLCILFILSACSVPAYTTVRVCDEGQRITSGNQFFHCVGPGDCTQVIRLCGRCLYHQSHLADYPYPL